MANRLVRPVELEYIPGQEYIPARPAYCTTVTKTVRFTEQYTIDDWRRRQEYLEGFGEPEGEQFSGYENFDDSLYRGGSQRTTKTKEVTEEVCYDAVEGQEGRDAQVIRDIGEDWQAGAISISSISDGQGFGFSLPDNPRVAVGLTYEDNGPGFADLVFGIVIRSQSGVRSIDVVEDGVVVSQQVGYYSPGDKVVIGRSGGEMVAYVGAAGEVGRRVTPHELPTKLDAMLYTSTDYVDSPYTTTMTEEGLVSDGAVFGVGFQLQLSTEVLVNGEVGFTIQTNEVVDGEHLVSVSLAVGFTAQTVNNTTMQVDESATGYFGFAFAPYTFEQSNVLASLPTVHSLSGDYDYGSGELVFPQAEVTATGGQPDLDLQGAALVFSPVRIACSGLTGSVGDVDVTLGALNGVSSDYVYGEVSVALGAMTSYSDWGISEDPLFYGYTQEVLMGDTIYTEPVILVSYTEELELGEAELTALIAVDESSIEGLMLETELSLQEFIERSIESGLDLSTTSGDIPQELLQYAFNLTNGAATRYSGFGFTDFAHTNGRTFAVAKDGLYELDPLADDNGQPISAMVDFGATDFGTSVKKYLETMFLGINTDGQVYAKVYADGGKERIYRAIQPGPTRRVRTARGISAREWQFKLELVDVNEVDLSDVEFVVAASSRRWRR